MIRIIISLLLWSLVAIIIFLVNPNTFAIIPVFFILLFLALYITLASIFKNTRRGLVITSAIILFLLLRYFGMGNFINLALIAGVTAAIEIYFWYTKPNESDSKKTARKNPRRNHFKSQ